MRKVKPPEERRQEIITVAERLFFVNGYAKTKITDIIKEMGMSKGIFYYYFESKEEVLDAIIQSVIDRDIAAATAIAADPALNAHEKVFRIIVSHHETITQSHRSFVKQIHDVEDPEIGFKTMRLTVLQLLPILVEVAEQGIREGALHIEYPHETVEFLLAAHTFQFFFGAPIKTEKNKQAYLRMLENALGAERGSFGYLGDILDE